MTLYLLISFFITLTSYMYGMEKHASLESQEDVKNFYICIKQDGVYRNRIKRVTPYDTVDDSGFIGLQEIYKPKQKFSLLTVINYENNRK